MNAYDLMSYINKKYKDYSGYPVFPKAHVISGGPNNEEELVISLAESPEYSSRGEKPDQKLNVADRYRLLLPIFSDMSFTINTTTRQITTKISDHTYINFYDSSYDNNLAQLSAHIFNNFFAGVDFLSSALFFAEIEEMEDPSIGGLDVVDLGVSKP